MSGPQPAGAAAIDAPAEPRRARTAALPRDHWRFDLAVTLLGLLLLLVWETSGIDLVLSRAYGSASGFAWRDAWLTRTLLHDGGRVVAWSVLALWVGRASWSSLRSARRADRWYWIAASLACLLLVPTIKQLTHSSCPWELAEFGGVAAYVPHWQLGVYDGGPGHCFPSGHAVAAFGFLGVYFHARDRHPQRARWTLALILVAGAGLGWAQLARGAHYASHTLWSAWLCWVVCAAAAWWQRQRAGAVQSISA